MKTTPVSTVFDVPSDTTLILLDATPLRQTPPVINKQIKTEVYDRGTLETTPLGRFAFQTTYKKVTLGATPHKRLCGVVL